MDKFFVYNNYFFVFTHPDDEAYACVLIKRLIDLGKEVHAVYITSGDAGGQGKEREAEVGAAMKCLGVKNNNIHFIRALELSFLDNLDIVVGELEKLGKKYSPDCLVGHDYEGGHEGHDAASFCTSEVKKKLAIPGYFVFPVYHGRPAERKGARFKPGRNNIIQLDFTEAERAIKECVLAAHQSQKSHFDSMKLEEQYSQLLFSREVFVEILEPINYRNKPMPEVGYESHRNGFKFLDFIGAIDNYYKE